MLNALPVGEPVTIHMWPRAVDGPDQYRFFLAVDPQGDLTAQFTVSAGGATTPLGSSVRVGSGYAAGDWWHVRVAASGTNPTTLRGRAWKDGAPEPTTWALEVTDSAPSLQKVSQSVKVGIYAGTVSDPPLRLAIDDLEIDTPGQQ